MGRAPRIDLGGHVYHILNRANGRRTLFEHDMDYLAFGRKKGVRDLKLGLLPVLKF
jgi:hypothetical protein